MALDHAAALITLLALALVLGLALTRGIAAPAHGPLTASAQPVRFWSLLAGLTLWLGLAALLLAAQDVRGYCVLALPPLAFACRRLGLRAKARVRAPDPDPSVLAIVGQRLGNTLAYWVYCLAIGLLGFPIMLFVMALVFPQLLRPSQVPVGAFAPPAIDAPPRPR